MTALPRTAISPCPNDTFAFYQFAAENTCTLDYLDIEQLNLALLRHEYPVAKGSFAIMEKIAGHYEILTAGAAIGRGVGPVFVGKLFDGARVGLPGENTTAHRLFRYWQKNTGMHNLVTVQMPFHRMLPAVLAQELDAAVLIHEGRFVYAARGLNLIADLGAYWEQETGAMIPLGCIYAQKSLPAEIKEEYTRALKAAITFSRQEYRADSPLYRGRILPHILSLAQEQDSRVAEAHIDTYVTDDTVELSVDALKSIDVFRQKCLI